MTSWARVGETYQLKYQNQNVSSQDRINYELALSRGADNLSQSFKFQSIGPGVKEHIYENFLQVKTLIKLTLFFPFINGTDYKHSSYVALK